MPKKVRELKRNTKKGRIYLYSFPAKGSHSKWKHHQLSQAIIIAGRDGDDAKVYLEKQVAQAIKLLKEINRKGD